MAVRNKRPDLNGVLVIDKPLTWTSFDVCKFIRARTGGAKVGHAGTLDPLATGVLVVCLGKATSQIDRFMAGEKGYLARVDLSAFTTTDDAEGPRTDVEVSSIPALEQIRAACGSFTGTIMQRPPAFSAIKVGGERAYRLARRAGDDGPLPEIAARPVTIHQIDIVAYTWPLLELNIRCGKGTYIRSLARDLGRSLGTGGTLAALRRTKVGEFDLSRAMQPSALPDPLGPEHLMPMNSGVSARTAPTSFPSAVAIPGAGAGAGAGTGDVPPGPR